MRHKHNWATIKLITGDALYECCTVCGKTRENKRSKYGNRKVHLDGYVFDSQAEANYYGFVKMRLAAGDIADLKVHPTYLLQDSFRGRDGKVRPKITYKADFEFLEGGRKVVVDVKGKRTEAFNIKKKMFEWIYTIDLTIENAKDWR